MTSTAVNPVIGQRLRQQGYRQPPVWLPAELSACPTHHYCPGCVIKLQPAAASHLYPMCRSDVPVECGPAVEDQKPQSRIALQPAKDELAPSSRLIPSSEHHPHPPARRVNLRLNSHTPSPPSHAPEPLPSPRPLLPPHPVRAAAPPRSSLARWSQSSPCPALPTPRPPADS